MKRSFPKSLTRCIDQSSASNFKRFAFLLLGLFFLFCLSHFFTSCNVTRVISNESQFYQRGDTSVVIQTKTIETYDATKKL